MNHEQEKSESRATAYVFGELSPEDVASFEKELDGSAELRDEVAGIEEAVAALQGEFNAESQGVSDADRVRIEAAMASRPAPAVGSALESSGALDGSGRKWLIGLAVAAGVLILVGLALPRATNNADTTLQVSQAMDQDNTTVENSVLEVDEYADSPVAATQTESISLAAEPQLLTSPVVTGLQSISGKDGQLSSGREVSDRVALTDASKKFAAERRILSSAPIAGTAMPTAAETPEAAPMSEVANKKADFDVSAPSRANYGLESRSQQNRAAKESGAVTRLAIPQPAAPGGGGPSADGATESYSIAPVETTLRYKRLVESKKEALGLAKQPMRSRRVVVDAKQQLGREVESLKTESKPSMEVEEIGFGREEIRSGDRFDPIVDNSFMKVGEAPLSTLSVDVDTASYSKVRMYLMQHKTLPDPNAVRIEELLNYFTYDYAPPKPQAEHPFAATVSVSQCPWNSKNRLARVAIKGKVIEEARPASNLVFLLDVSGSMNRPNKLPLVVDGMKMLTKQLGENDMVALVVYAGAAGLVLDSTCGDDKEIIVDALDRLRAGGSTAGAQGIQLAYNIARDNFIPGGTNRVILCTDGDFNVGVTNTDALVKMAEQNAKGNIFLSVLGFGSGNHNDAMMEQISNKGNGNYAFIDSKKEAQKVLVEQMGGTLVTIAKDVKIQVEFNPKEVASYRLIGYENRVLAAEDFNDDSKDAGEIGAGHTVTALFELVPQDDDAEITLEPVELSKPEVDPLRYRKKLKLSKRANSGELLMLKLRYKQPEGSESTLIEAPVKDGGKSFNKMDADFKFAGTVAAFGMLLRNSPHKGNATFAAVEEMAGDGIGADKHGRRSEFIEMVKQARELSGEK